MSDVLNAILEDAQPLGMAIEEDVRDGWQANLESYLCRPW